MGKSGNTLKKDMISSFMKDSGGSKKATPCGAEILAFINCVKSHNDSEEKCQSFLSELDGCVHRQNQAVKLAAMRANSINFYLNKMMRRIK